MAIEGDSRKVTTFLIATGSVYAFCLEYFEKMKVVIQRVKHSCVKVDEEMISSIGRGLLVLVGIFSHDTTEDLEYVAKKVLNVRFFENEDGKKWSKSVVDKQFEILCVSQFTLCQSLKGNRLDFHQAMNPADSLKFYEKFLNFLKTQYKPEMIKDGKFGAYMQVELCNDGPVTVNLESKNNKSITNSENCDRN